MPGYAALYARKRRGRAARERASASASARRAPYVYDSNYSNTNYLKVFEYIF